MLVENPPIYISEKSVLIVVALIVLSFSAVIMLVMFRDYRLYIENFCEEKCSFFEFVKREQFYVCLLLFFFFLVGVELCMQLVLAAL